MEVYKDQQRAWRQSEEDKRYADLAAGQKQYQVAIVAANGHQDIIQGPRETKVSSLTVGGSSPDEAIGKFCRFAGITGGMENVKIVG